MEIPWVTIVTDFWGESWSMQPIPLGFFVFCFRQNVRYLPGWDLAVVAFVFQNYWYILRRNVKFFSFVLNGDSRIFFGQSLDTLYQLFITICFILQFTLGVLYTSHHLIYTLTARVVGAPQMISQPVSSISPMPSGTWRTPGLSIPWCCLPTRIPNRKMTEPLFEHCLLMRQMMGLLHADRHISEFCDLPRTKRLDVRSKIICNRTSVTTPFLLEGFFTVVAKIILKKKKKTYSMKISFFLIISSNVIFPSEVLFVCLHQP